MKIHTHIVVEKQFQNNFLKNQKSLDQQCNVFYSFLLLYFQFEGFRNILKQSCRPLAFISNKDLIFIKHKEVWKQPPCLIFYMGFEEKYLSCYILLTVQISLSGCLYLLIYWLIYVLQLFVNQAVTSYILKVTLSF